MVVTDLHGDWPAYCRYRDRFIDLQGQGQADCLIFTGDLIHSDRLGKADKSVEIILDLLALQAQFGPAIIYLSGNHELPHLYGISLSKGDHLYTPGFEAALNDCGRRAEVMALFDSLPFYLRSRAGVSLTHAGACAILSHPNRAHQLFNWSHRALWSYLDELVPPTERASMRRGYEKLGDVSYEELAKEHLAVTGPDDPRYDDLLKGYIIGMLPQFNEVLWPALFTRCEQEYGLSDYRIFLEAMLQDLSLDFVPQQWLVAGHMTIGGGHQLIAERHLRLASAHHATPTEAGQYLLFDAGQSIKQMEHLTAGLGSVYRTN